MKQILCTSIACLTLLGCTALACWTFRAHSEKYYFQPAQNTIALYQFQQQMLRGRTNKSSSTFQRAQQ